MSHRASHAKTQRAQTRLPPEIDPEFQIAPMIDILLVLLVFFMSISSTEVLQKTHDLQLPAADSVTTRGVSTGQVILNIPWVSATNTGSIVMDGVTYPDAAHLLPKLQEMVQ